ncbi:MAG: hypothetical protein ACO3I4_08935 [Candidatus Kapaibacteriota bacterium]
MFERELERARKGLRDQLATRAPYVTLKDLQALPDLHPAYRAFFGAEVQWWIHEERALRTSNPRFDTSEPAFRELFARLDEAYVRHARFDHEELTAATDAAVKVRLNMLCRPRTTLKWFVFRGEPTKPLHEVLLRLDYVYDHGYLTDGLRQWIETRRADALTSLDILSIVEFERVVEKIDNDAILDLSQDDFVALLDPMYEWFAAYHTDLPADTVPTEAVIIFLDDKGAIPLSQTLERKLYRENLKFLSRSAFFDVIDLVISEIETGVQRPAFTAQPEPTPEPEPEPEPKPAPELTPEPEPEPAQPPVATNAYDVRYERYIAHIGPGGRERFLKRLFSADDVEMEMVVGDVLGSETWKIAAAKLDRWLVKRGITATNAIAMEFTHALNRAFR